MGRIVRDLAMMMIVAMPIVVLVCLGAKSLGLELPWQWVAAMVLVLCQMVAFHIVLVERGD